MPPSNVSEPDDPERQRSGCEVERQPIARALKTATAEPATDTSSVVGLWKIVSQELCKATQRTVKQLWQAPHPGKITDRKPCTSFVDHARAVYLEEEAEQDPETARRRRALQQAHQRLSELQAIKKTNALEELIKQQRVLVEEASDSFWPPTVQTILRRDGGKEIKRVERTMYAVLLCWPIGGCYRFEAAAILGQNPKPAEVFAQLRRRWRKVSWWIYGPFVDFVARSRDLSTATAEAPFHGRA
jgi:hypothetical protein